MTTRDLIGNYSGRIDSMPLGQHTSVVMVAPETIAAVPILIASLIGSPHCIGMCGGFVAIYSHSCERVILPHILYSLGRLTTYLSLGIASASLGNSIDSLTGVAELSSLIIGAALISLGTVQLFRGSVRYFEGLHKTIGNWVGKAAAPILKSRSKLKPFLIGLITTLLPCGWLYAFLALALSSANISGALVIMTFFWLGTLPAMLAFGMASRLVTTRLAAVLPRLTALLLIFSGLLSFTMHLAHRSHNHSSGHPSHHQRHSH